MADDFVANAGSGGETFRSLEQSGGILWPCSVVCWATTVSPGANVVAVPVAAPLAYATANPTALLIGSAIEFFNGTTWDRARGDTTNGLDVDVTRLPALVAGSAVIGAVTQSGTWNVTNVSGTISLPTGASTLAEQQSQTTALQLIDDVVHSGDAALSKYAVIGAVLDDTATVAVTENQASALRMSTRRALLVEGVASGTAVTVSGSGTFTVDSELPAAAKMPIMRVALVMSAFRAGLAPLSNDR